MLLVYGNSFEHLPKPGKKNARLSLQGKGHKDVKKIEVSIYKKGL